MALRKFHLFLLISFKYLMLTIASWPTFHNVISTHIPPPARLQSHLHRNCKNQDLFTGWCLFGNNSEIYLQEKLTLQDFKKYSRFG